MAITSPVRMRRKSGGRPAHAQRYFLLFTRELSLSHIDCPGDNTHFLFPPPPLSPPMSVVMPWLAIGL